jgi:SAM-dependent methyltransferase
MHESSYLHMQRLAARHLSERPPGRVFDIGAMDVNGSYRPIFEALGWCYTGCDISPGANVSTVLPSPYVFPWKSASADLIISGQAFEHIQFFWLTMLEIARVVRPGGLVFLIAPSRGPEHRYPVDCWRFYPDGYRSLAAWSGLSLLDVSTDWEPAPQADSAPWGDTVGVFGKSARPVGHRLRQWLLHRLSALLVRPGPGSAEGGERFG